MSFSQTFPSLMYWPNLYTCTHCLFFYFTLLFSVVDFQYAGAAGGWSVWPGVQGIVDE